MTRFFSRRFGWSLILAGDLPVWICPVPYRRWVGVHGDLEVQLKYTFWLCLKLRDVGCHWGGFFGGEIGCPGIDVA